MRTLSAGLAVLLLAACSPGQQSQPAPSDSGSASASAATSPAPDLVSSAQPLSCRAEIGEEASKDLAYRCRLLSPATRPPCNADNACQMIQDEIDRSCAIWDKDTSQPKPKECTA